MDAAERVHYLDLLRSGRDRYLAALDGVSDLQARFRPAADRWSIQDIAEHIAVTEHGMFRLITKYYEALEEPRPGKEYEILMYRGTDRSKALSAPERVRPKGRYASLEQAADQFRENRERTIDFLESCADDLRARMIDHPLGRITGLECLAVLITHPLRHVAQIEEIRSSTGFPTAQP